MTWRVGKASVTGSSHTLNSSECQDAHCTKILRLPRGHEYFIAIVADGAGSAQFGGIGADFVCKQAMKKIEEALSRSRTSRRVNRIALTKAVSSARAQLSRKAEKHGHFLRDYACTLLGAVVGRKDAWFFQCGDGAIVASQDGPSGIVFWPDSGEYANMTYFITDSEWRSNLRIEHAIGTFNELALLTDGLQRLALSFDSRTVFQPFFEPMFSKLKSSKDDDCETLNKHLERFLNSNAINERTDDDKTLVLAVR